MLISQGEFYFILTDNTSLEIMKLINIENITRTWICLIEFRSQVYFSSLRFLSNLKIFRVVTHPGDIHLGYKPANDESWGEYVSPTYINILKIVKVVFLNYIACVHWPSRHVHFFIQYDRSDVHNTLPQSGILASCVKIYQKYGMKVFLLSDKRNFFIF